MSALSVAVVVFDVRRLLSSSSPPCWHLLYLSVTLSSSLVFCFGAEFPILSSGTPLLGDQRCIHLISRNNSDPEQESTTNLLRKRAPNTRSD
ncbi:hypothetical protein LZ30DRAFT_111822 [Colletotrichum cereale]|nr:hypothetical protein LZ30DRAFT_111822 [Colletotrichum cereale]